MKFIFRLILILLATYFLPFYMPWWIIMIAAALIGYLMPGNLFGVFNSGFLGGGIVWLAMSLQLDLTTKSVMTDKIVQLFPLTDGTQLLILAGVIGGVATGFAAVTGSSFRNIFIKKTKKGLYS